MFFSKKLKKVADYYNKMTSLYIESGYGDVIQAHRPADVNELLRHIVQNAELANGLKILDAGCGIGGPAIYIAKHFDVHISAITNSQEQLKLALKKVEEAGLQAKINVIYGDFHKLDKLFAAESFDRVLMLESFGHAVCKKMLLKGVHHVLKNEGFIYIKDYFQKEINGTPQRRKGMRKAIQNMNRHYAYNLADLNKTIKILRELNFDLKYIKKNELTVDTQTHVQTFEHINNIDLFEGGFHYLFLDALELYFKKPGNIDGLIE